MFNTNFNQISKEDLSMNNQRTGRTYAELTERFNKLAEDFECRNMSEQARAKQKSERYLTSIHHIKKLLKSGLISQKEYDNFDTITANKYGISSCSIFREIA